MSTTLQQKQRGVWFARTGITIQEFEVVPPAPGEVLIKNVAVASNPKDWKFTELWYDREQEGIEGNDVAGYVEAVGEGVTEFKKGDRVAAFTKVNNSPKWGAYQEYSTALAGTTFLLPARTSFEEGATLPCCFTTAFIGLYKRLGIPAFNDPSDAGKVRGEPILIYGASGSVGAYAVQLAKLAGLYVVGVAGASGDYVRSLGADAVVDYRGKTRQEIVGAVEAALEGHGTLRYVCARHHFLARDPPDRNRRAEESGRHVDFPCLLEAGTIQPNRVRVIPGGLAGVSAGMDILRREAISGEKLVYRIAETPA
ncbi:hypothetical protein PLICRDRAFT_112571 [Plicaturopsis crispa FD-325 SS-3]|nr:hypothetical protein PLICRDRAFT_112571 [Plicaturopsis crispa FD-325 SS-3]